MKYQQTTGYTTTEQAKELLFSLINENSVFNRKREVSVSARCKK